jgi:hypothetical protein
VDKETDVLHCGCGDAGLWIRYEVIGLARNDDGSPMTAVAYGCIVCDDVVIP